MLFIYILIELLIGWIIASIYLVILMRNHNKTEADLLYNFAIIFICWPCIAPIYVSILIFDIIMRFSMWIGHITKKVISKLMSKVIYKKETIYAWHKDKENA